MTMGSIAGVPLALLILLISVSLLHGATGLTPISLPQDKPIPIPITVLSGFLGSGKTSLLRHLLQNKQGLRIAVIVNDVASVNIDSKLIASAAEGASGMVELQNGCACCSKSEELLSSVSELVMLSDLKGEELRFQHIVVEMSGVADPKSVRAKFQEATLYDMPLMDRVRLDTMVTVVDCSSFLQYLFTAKAATPSEAPELFYPDGIEPPPEPQDWMDDLPAPLLEALLAGESAYASSRLSSSSAEMDSGVSELLVSQTETSDVVLLNKIDLAGDKLTQISDIVTALNPRAKIYHTQYGNIDLNNILAVAHGRGVTEAGIVDDHRDSVNAFLNYDDDGTDSISSDPSHEHSSPSSNSERAVGIHESRLDPNHSHSHDHSCTEPECNDPSHSHSHDHSCTEPECNDPSHSHSHDHSCTEPECNDPSHSHSHSHQHATHAGIGTFVYRARRPFHPKRLLGLLRKLPVERGLPDSDDSLQESAPLSAATCNALKKTMRSKGFAWCADSNIAALYWSHAGASFDLQCLGRWWSTLGRDQWPPEAIPTLLADFDDPSHSDDDSSDTVGDRRQELVFIGQGLGNEGEQRSLKAGLDECLLNNDEWAIFRSKRASEEELKAAFPNPIPARMVSF